jgi:two-component system sensor histidine kinase AtoS
MPEPSLLESRLPNSTVFSYQEPGTGDLLSEVLAQLSEGVATLTADGVVVSWNPRAANLTGYTLGDINAVGLVHVFDPPQVLENLLRAARGGTPTLSERLVLQRADGRSLPVNVRCSPLRHLAGTPGRVVMVMRDLSELEILQHRLLQSERLSILGRLAGAVSHEIRNPLAAIFLHADVLADELQRPRRGDREQVLRSLAAIKEEVSRLHDLVQQYLSLARLSDLRREPVDLSAFLNAFGQETQERLQTRGITLRLEGMSQAVQVALHTNSFRRVLLNLLNNALEAMPQGGTLTLRLRRRKPQVFLEVSDTGCGIPPEQVPLLFSPFHSTKPEGTGLGLYLVREIVTAHQGEITVTSAPGVGTTFTVRLPLLAPEKVLVQAGSMRSEANGQHSRC